MSEAPRTLSERETDVLRLLATGASNQQIADELHITVNTVKVHVRNIFDKLGAQTRTEATVYAIHAGLVPLPRAALDEATRRAEEALATGTGVLTAPASDNGAPSQAPDDAAAGEAATVAAPLAPTPARGASRLLLWLAPLLVAALALTGALVWQRTQAQPAPSATAAPRDPSGAPITTVGQRWLELSPLPTARGGLAVVAQGDSLYAIGGQTAAGVTGQVERFSLDNTWTARQSKPTPVRDVSAAVLGGQIYVPGGCDGDGRPVDVVEVYQPSSNQWTTAAKLPRPLCGYALAAVEGKLYLVGGWDGSTYRAETLIYTPGGAGWQEGPPMPTARAYAGAAVLDGTLHVIGGSNGAPLTTHEALDPAAETAGSAWKTYAPLPAPRARLGAASVGRSIYALGGGAGDLGLASYDASKDSWRVEETPFSEDWQGLGLAANDLRLYALGGDGPRATNRAYQALFQLILPVGRPNP